MWTKVVGDGRPKTGSGGTKGGGVTQPQGQACAGPRMDVAAPLRDRQN